MNTPSTLHENAMRLYDLALSARRNGDEPRFHEMVCDALKAESSAAELFSKEPGLEPTRSILYRSAATIAVAAREFEKAIALSGAGLAGDSVPPDIRSELVSIIKDANFRLVVRESDSVSIGEESITMSLEGGAVGNGMVRHDVFKAKIGSIVTLINRTIDRMSGVKFGEARAKLLNAPIFVSPPIPGSFAIEVRLGDQLQPTLAGLPGPIDADNILSEVVECFQEFKDGDLDALRERMPSDEYFTNFMALSRALQPDGAKITSVELVGKLHRGTKRVRITTPRKRATRSQLKPDTSELVEITGLLRVAEKRNEGEEKVEIVDESGKWHHIHVPAALMADVVRPLWDSRVVIVARQGRGRRNLLELETIDPA